MIAGFLPFVKGDEETSGDGWNFIFQIIYRGTLRHPLTAKIIARVYI
jgi:hypothetical protein